MKWIYRSILFRLVLFAFKALAYLNKKVREGLEARASAPWRLAPPGATPLPWYWFHVSSGEFEYAKPVIRMLKSARPCRVVVTYFSPSVVPSLIKFKEVDHFLPTPWDRPKDWNDFLKAFNPECLAIARTDVWPEMIWSAKAFGVPTVLFSATLPEHSPRVSNFLSRLFYGSFIGLIDEILCVSAADELQFRRYRLKGQITVSGDTRFDQVKTRLAENRPLLNLGSIDPFNTFIYGSTWEEDELQILGSIHLLNDLKKSVILVPHEPTPAHIEKLLSRLKDHGVKTSLYSKTTQWTGEGVLIVDVTGILADLYTKSHVAFVGGSFKKSVHSVMEPAAAGNVVFFGPFFHNNREAERLVALGFAFEVYDSASAVEFVKAMNNLSREQKLKRKNAITEFVNSQTGASRVAVNTILKLSQKT
ncbi:MAG: hypothetical protein IT289_01960 [Oligoflexia bacterium]|nr:hypothetical protein [Oligoflexia bacterium]